MEIPRLCQRTKVYGCKQFDCIKQECSIKEFVEELGCSHDKDPGEIFLGKVLEDFKNMSVKEYKELHKRSLKND